MYVWGNKMIIFGMLIMTFFTDYCTGKYGDIFVEIIRIMSKLC
jgi:hypothetical protein